MTSLKPFFAVAALLAFAGGFAWLQSDAEPEARSPDAISETGRQSLVGGPFALTNHLGEQVTEADFHGRYQLIYFGYTSCSSVCPINLGSMVDAVDMLGPLSDEVAPIFITVDPGTDTVEAMAEYVPLFGDRLIGLTGTYEGVQQAAANYRIFYEEVMLPDRDYIDFNHTSLTFLMDRDGRYLAHFNDDEAPERIADTIFRMIRMLEPRREMPEIILAANEAG